MSEQFTRPVCFTLTPLRAQPPPGLAPGKPRTQGVTSQSVSPSPGLLALVQPFHTHHISNTMDSQAGGGSSGASLCLPQAYGAWPGTGRPACVSGGSAPQPPIRWSLAFQGALLPSGSGTHTPGAALSHGRCGQPPNMEMGQQGLGLRICPSMAAGTRRSIGRRPH